MSPLFSLPCSSNLILLLLHFLQTFPKNDHPNVTETQIHQYAQSKGNRGSSFTGCSIFIWLENPPSLLHDPSFRLGDDRTDGCTTLAGTKPVASTGFWRTAAVAWLTQRGKKTPVPVDPRFPVRFPTKTSPL